MTKKACGRCRHYFEERRECRRFPPYVFSDFDGGSSSTCYAFPIMRENEWCGEFKGRVEGGRIETRPEDVRSDQAST